MNKLAADVRTGPVQFMPFEGCEDKNLNTLAAHPKCHKLQRKSLACAAGSQNRQVGVFVDAAVEDVHDDKRVVVLVDAQQNAVIVAHFIAGKGVAACGAQGQHVALGAFIQLLFQRNQRKCR
ncbi:hypothetical protein DSECCO2_588030 [anaerobic digester metagenome]